MAKLKKFLFPLFAFNVIIQLSSCSDSNNEPQMSDTPQRSLKDYAMWGQLHNDMLKDAAIYVSEPESRVIGDDDAKPNYDELNRQQILYAMSLDLDSDTKSIICSGLQEYKPYYDTEAFYNEYFARKNGKRKILEIVKQMKNDGSIDAFEYECISSIAGMVAQYKEGIISLSFFQNALEEYSIRWENKYRFADPSLGQTSGYILSIAQSSVEWWDENDIPETRAAHWIVADVGGAIVGGGLEALQQYLKNGRISNWTRVGGKALAHAVISSTGIVLKVGRWLFNTIIRKEKQCYLFHNSNFNTAHNIGANNPVINSRIPELANIQG